MLELIAGTEVPIEAVSFPEKQWMLRLYVAGQTFGSMLARTNLHKICEQHLPDQYHVEIIDLLENPRLAKEHQIIAVPTLVRNRPSPVRKIIGDLSNTERVLIGLDIHSG